MSDLLKSSAPGGASERNESNSLEALVAQVADEFMERLERGDEPDIEEYACRYPQHETVIRQVLSSLRVIRLSGPGSGSGGSLSGTDEDISGCLGDFRLLREIGRGGWASSTKRSRFRWAAESR
jgi:hypothetical protein